MLNTKYIGTKYSWNFGQYEKTERIIMMREGKKAGEIHRKCNLKIIEMFYSLKKNVVRGTQSTK